MSRPDPIDLLTVAAARVSSSSARRHVFRGGLAVALLVAGAAVGCGGGRKPTIPPGLTATAPTPAEVAAVRRQGARLAEGATVVVNLIDSTGDLVNDLSGLAPAIKDKYDCAVMQLTGIDAPSSTNLRLCGPLPKVADTTLAKVRTAAQALTSCASLRSTVAIFLRTVQPFIAQLSFGDSPSLTFAATALSGAIQFAQRFLEGGAECSQ